MPKKAKTSKKFAFGFTQAATVGITLSRENYFTFILDAEVDKKDLTRWIKNNDSDDRKGVLVCQGLSVYDTMLTPKVVKALKKRDISVLLCDTVLNLEGRFTPLDGEKGADNAWRSIRITVPMLENMIAGKSTLPTKKSADLDTSSVPFKIKKKKIGTNKKASKSVAVKRPTLQGLVTRISKHISGRNDKTKVRDAIVKVALGKKAPDSEFVAKVKKFAIKRGTPKGDFVEVLEHLTAMSEDARLGKAYRLLAKGKTAAKVVRSVDERDQGWFEGNLGYALKVFPIEDVEPKTTKKKRSKKK